MEIFNAAFSSLDVVPKCTGTGKQEVNNKLGALQKEIRVNLVTLLYLSVLREVYANIHVR